MSLRGGPWRATATIASARILRWRRWLALVSRRHGSIGHWVHWSNSPITCHGCQLPGRGLITFIYRGKQKALELWRYLVRRRKVRRPMRARRSRATIRDKASLHDRPEAVNGRAEAGHWEADLIICKRTRPVLVLHERGSCVTLAARLTGKSAAETVFVMMGVFRRIDPALRRSVTFDNDTVFARHALLRSMFDMTIWFYDAYASWQKGGVENANSRLRRWLPRSIDIDAVSDEELQ